MTPVVVWYGMVCFFADNNTTLGLWWVALGCGNYIFLTYHFRIFPPGSQNINLSNIFLETTIRPKFWSHHHCLCEQKSDLRRAKFRHGETDPYMSIVQASVGNHYIYKLQTKSLKAVSKERNALGHELSMYLSANPKSVWEMLPVIFVQVMFINGT